MATRSQEYLEATALRDSPDTGRALWKDCLSIRQGEPTLVGGRLQDPEPKVDLKNLKNWKNKSFKSELFELKS